MLLTVTPFLQDRKKMVSCTNNSCSSVIGSCTRLSVPLLSLLINIKHFLCLICTGESSFQSKHFWKERLQNEFVTDGAFPQPPAVFTKGKKGTLSCTTVIKKSTQQKNAVSCCGSVSTTPLNSTQCNISVPVNYVCCR